jgi:hypothetical protein
MNLDALSRRFQLPLTPERGARLLAKALREIEGPALTPVEHALLVHLIARAERETLPRPLRLVLMGLLVKVYGL